MTVWTQNVESMVEYHIPVAISNIIYWDHCSLPKTNRSAPKNRTSQRKFIFQPSIVRCELVVSGKVILLMVQKSGEKTTWDVCFSPVANNGKNYQPPLVFSPHFLNHQQHLKLNLFESHNTPWKINMEHNNGGLEDHVPF